MKERTKEIENRRERERERKRQITRRREREKMRKESIDGQDFIGQRRPGRQTRGVIGRQA